MDNLFEIPDPEDLEDDPSTGDGEDNKKNDSSDDDHKKEMDELKKKVDSLEKNKTDLNIALHQNRQGKKKEPQEKLTPDQVKELLSEHKDDPETLYNLVNYIASQSAQEQFTAKEINDLQSQSKKYVQERWPDIKDPGSDLSKAVENSVASLHLDSHPLKQYLGISSLIAEKLPEIQKIAYEQGVEDAAKGKAQPKNLTPSSGAKGKKKVRNSATAKQLGLTKSQRAVYEKLLGGDDDEE